MLVLRPACGPRSGSCLSGPHAYVERATRHTVLPGRRAGGALPAPGVPAKMTATLQGDCARRAARRAPRWTKRRGRGCRRFDLLIVTSVTGVAVPSLDARLIPRLGLRPDIKRLPVFGLGCVAGAAGLARLHDYLLAWPGHVAALLSVELCR